MTDIDTRAYEAMQFLIDRGIDMTIVDYRWNAAAEGWARYAAKDEQMPTFWPRPRGNRSEGRGESRRLLRGA